MPTTKIEMEKVNTRTSSESFQLKIFLSDRGSLFERKQLKNFWIIRGVLTKISSRGYAKTDSITQRAIQSLKKQIQFLTYGQRATEID
jgi:hypothetical protein